jgi:uncharacterized protein YeaO (DUF488 family)
MTVRMKRVYDPPAADDGARVLVDRLWPRGLTKSEAALDEWLKDVAPSHELRKWYHAHPAQWEKFRKKYLEELGTEAANRALQELYALAASKRQLTLLFASKSMDQNHALILKNLLEGKRKPPTGTGPGAAEVRQKRVAQRRRS